MKYFQYALYSIAWADDRLIHFMLTKDLLFQNNSRIKWYLLFLKLFFFNFFNFFISSSKRGSSFLKLCRHIRRKPSCITEFKAGNKTIFQVCADKTGFRRPGHLAVTYYYYNFKLFIYFIIAN